MRLVITSAELKAAIKEAANTGYKGTYKATGDIIYKSVVPFMKKDDTVEIVQSLKNEVRYRKSASPTIFELPTARFAKWIEDGLLVPVGREVSASSFNLGKLKSIMRSNGFLQILLDSPSCGAGAFDGGCLIVARGMQAVLGGEIVRIDSALPDGKQQPEHYGLLIPSGKVVDGDGVHPSPQAWLKHFETEEGPFNRPLSLATGVGTPGEIPDDPQVSKELAAYVSARIRS